MKKSLLIFLILILAKLSLCQSIQKFEVLRSLSKINTKAEAEIYLNQNTSRIGSVGTVYSNIDSSQFAKLVFAIPKGETFDFLTSDSDFVHIVKPLEQKETIFYRVNYIFLDNSQYSKEKIDSIRGLIKEKLSNNVSFKSLAQEYSMDSNSKNGGDLGWFPEGRMVDVFEESIKKHSKGDIYFVDVPENKWYYIVKNTYNPSKELGINYLYIKLKR